MGIVYSGVCPADGGLVAVTTFLPKAKPSPKQIARFLRDTAILRQLQHPHVVAFRDLGQSAKGQLYCVMEYVPGTDAAHILARTGPLPVPGPSPRRPAPGSARIRPRQGVRASRHQASQPAGD